MLMKKLFIELFSTVAIICVLIAAFINVSNMTIAFAEETESTLSISLKGNSTIWLKKGTEYKEFGATAHDTVEGDLSENITISNNVKEDTVGTYTVSYSVSNASFETASVSRTVIVYDNVKSETLKIYRNTSYSIPTFRKIVELEDGGFIAYGEYYSSYSDEYTVRFDKDFNIVWEKSDYSISGYDYAKDLVVNSAYVITLLYSSNNTRNYVTIRDITDGTVKIRYQINSSNYTHIDQLSENKYIVYLFYKFLQHC